MHKLKLLSHPLTLASHFLAPQKQEYKSSRAWYSEEDDTKHSQKAKNIRTKWNKTEVLVISRETDSQSWEGL